jgi:hypothetical protein
MQFTCPAVERRGGLRTVLLIFTARGAPTHSLSGANFTSRSLVKERLGELGLERGGSLSTAVKPRQLTQTGLLVCRIWTVWMPITQQGNGQAAPISTGQGVIGAGASLLIRAISTVIPPITE